MKAMRSDLYGTEATTGSSEQDFSDEASRHVQVFGSPEDCVDLASMLERLNYSVLTTPPHILPNERPAPFLSIVMDSAHEPWEQCRNLAPEHPIILVSSHPGFAARLEAARSGVNALIRRPISPIELAEWLTHFRGFDAQSNRIAVLIVDDDWLTTELYAGILRAAGMTVETVNDPRMALQAIEVGLPDLVLMDMQMPGVDGVELAKIIRQTRQFISLPIIFLSAERDEARQLEARRLGGDDFVAKSIAPEKLISVIRLRAERAQLLRSLIERDGLTGLYDHSRFNERLSHELERCRRNGAELSLVMIDIDHFKGVNDAHGHPVGDDVLRTLASCLMADLRRIDIVGRYGGEEFGVILLDTDPDYSRVVIDKIRNRFGRLAFKGEGGSFGVTFSAGIASSRQHADLPSLISSADQALYRAKDSGRDNVRIAEPSPTVNRNQAPTDLAPSARSR
jgi:diguanylate cyclase (GGDEF)-like protein